MKSARRVVLATLISLGAAALAAPGGPQPSPTLKAPEKGAILVAFVISEGAVVIDFTGPWEVFQDAATPRNVGFQLYTVAATKDPIHTSGGLQIIPDYTFATAPAPRIVVVPAQHGYRDPALQNQMDDWLRSTSESDDLTMSVCTGAFKLAAAGLLDGKFATTIHGAWSRLAQQFPKVHVERGARFVEDGKVATSGGLSSGIDLALRVVERYFGRAAAEQTALEMEYQGTGWKNRNSNANYVAIVAAQEKADARQVLSGSSAVDPVCGMTIDIKDAPSTIYDGKKYYFCSSAEKDQFVSNPRRYLQ